MIHTISTTPQLIDALLGAADGDVVHLAPGEYRPTETPQMRRPNVTLRGEPGAVISGAVRVDAEWEDIGEGFYSTPWRKDWPLVEGTGKTPNTVWLRRESLIVDGSLLARRGSDELDHGQVSIDRHHNSADKNVLARLATPPQTLEIARLETLLEIAVAGCTIEGITFRHSASPRQGFAVDILGEHCLVKDCIFEQHNGGGLGIHAEDVRLEHVICRDNGIEGWGGTRAHGLHAVDCRILRNGTMDPRMGHGHGGGGKFTRTQGAQFERCLFVDNYGSGLWLDENNEGIVVDRCVFAGNHKQAVFFEKGAYGCVARDSVFVGTKPDPMSPNLFPGVGVDCFSIITDETMTPGRATGVRIDGNVFMGNALDIQLHADPRGYTGFCTVQHNQFMGPHFPIKLHGGGDSPLTPTDQIASHRFARNQYTTEHAAYLNTESRLLTVAEFEAGPWHHGEAVRFPTERERALQRRIDEAREILS